MNPDEISIDNHDALLYIVSWVREGCQSSRANYGYHVYLPNVIRSHLRSNYSSLSESDVHRATRSLSSSFYAAAWDLCRRGVLRPGVTRMGEQATGDGSAGNGYSVTPFGETWIAESEQDTFVPTEPGRFARMLKPYAQQFGPGFDSRAQEAIRCYGAHAYLACCAMCGAAAESVLLAAAKAKTGDEGRVLREYASAQGRARVARTLVGQANEHVKREFEAHQTLLKYWRDEASHGKASDIADNEAYTALGLLLRFAMFVSANWTDITRKSRNARSRKQA